MIHQTSYIKHHTSDYIIHHPSNIIHLKASGFRTIPRGLTEKEIRIKHMKKDKTKQREQRHACMTFVESRRKSIESSVRPVARVGCISAAAGATDRHQSGSDSVRKELACPYDTYLSLVIQSGHT